MEQPSDDFFLVLSNQWRGALQSALSSLVGCGQRCVSLSGGRSRCSLRCNRVSRHFSRGCDNSARPRPLLALLLCAALLFSKPARSPFHHPRTRSQITSPVFANLSKLVPNTKTPPRTWFQHSSTSTNSRKTFPPPKGPPPLPLNPPRIRTLLQRSSRRILTWLTG